MSGTDPASETLSHPRCQHRSVEKPCLLVSQMVSLNQPQRVLFGAQFVNLWYRKGWVSGLLSLPSLHSLETTSFKQSVRRKVDWAIHIEQSVMRMVGVEGRWPSFHWGPYLDEC